MNNDGRWRHSGGGFHARVLGRRTAGEWPSDYIPAGWLQLTREHRAGVEIQNHWRRDVLIDEDRSRSRDPNLLANVALIRNTLLYGLTQELENSSTPTNTQGAVI